MTGGAPPSALRRSTYAASASTTPPLLASGITQVFVPPDPTLGPALHYRPHLYANATARFVDAKKGLDTTASVARLAPFGDGVVAIDWSTSETTDVQPGDLEREPRSGATFAALPASAANAKSYATLAKDFGRFVAMTSSLTVMRCADLGATSKADEDERAFRIRLQGLAREQRDAEKDKLQQKYAPKIAALVEKERRAQEAQAKEAQQSTQQKLQTALSFGATILGAFMGKSAMSASNIGRAVTAAKGVGRSFKEAEDVKRA